MGRKTLEQYSDGTPLNGNTSGIKIKTIHEHFSGGTRVITSSPYRTAADATLQWTCTQYDTAGRVTAVATFNNNNCNVAILLRNIMMDNINISHVTY
jgi:hypothetical protein